MPPSETVSTSKKCNRCGGQDTGPANFLLTCSDCRRSFHHRCHIPPVPDKDMIAMLDATMNKDVDNGIYGWSCKRCSKKSRAGSEHAVAGSQPPQRPLSIVSRNAMIVEVIESEDVEPAPAPAAVPGLQLAQTLPVDRRASDDHTRKDSLSQRPTASSAVVPSKRAYAPPLPALPRSSSSSRNPLPARPQLSPQPSHSLPDPTARPSGDPLSDASGYRHYEPPSHLSEAAQSARNGFRQPAPPQRGRRPYEATAVANRRDSWPLTQTSLTQNIAHQHQQLVPLHRHSESSQSSLLLDIPQVSHAQPFDILPMDVDSDTPPPPEIIPVDMDIQSEMPPPPLLVDRAPPTPAPSALPDFRAITSRLRAEGKLDPPDQGRTFLSTPIASTSAHRNSRESDAPSDADDDLEGLYGPLPHEVRSRTLPREYTPLHPTPDPFEAEDRAFRARRFAPLPRMTTAHARSRSPEASLPTPKSMSPRPFATASGSRSQREPKDSAPLREKKLIPARDCEVYADSKEMKAFERLIAKQVQRGKRAATKVKAKKRKSGSKGLFQFVKEDWLNAKPMYQPAAQKDGHPDRHQTNLV